MAANKITEEYIFVGEIKRMPFIRGIERTILYDNKLHSVWFRKPENYVTVDTFDVSVAHMPEANKNVVFFL